MEILLPILFLLALVLWLRSKKMTPEDKLPQCEVILAAPVVAPRAQALNYQLALSLGPVSELWETWITASGGGGPYGEGRVPGQVPAVSLGNGVYTQDISTLPPGDYLLWARCIDRNSACLGAWTAHVLQVTTGSGAAAPMITTNNGAPIALMTTAGSTVSQVFVATGTPTLTWSLSGPNAGLFTVTPATGPIVTVQTPSGLPAGSYSVTVGVSNGQGAASSNLSAVASSNSAAPQNTTAPTVSGGAVVSGLLSNTAGAWSGIPTPSVLREWVRGDSDTGPWTVMSLATAGVSFAAPASSLGKYVAVRETGSNEVGAPIVVLSNRLGPVTAANAAPALSSVSSIYGSAIEGSSLGYGEGVWTGNPLPSVTRQLQRSPNGVDGWTTVQAAVPGSAFYTITNASNAQYLSVLETASNGVGAPAVYRTNVIGPVTQSGSPPVNATLPTISGSAQVAQAISYVGGTWNGVPAPTVSRQWQSSANGLDNWETVAAANSGTPRTVAAGDANRYVSVLETASNGVGSPVSRRSNVIGPMQAVQPTNTVPAAITGASEVGAGTTYVRGVWAGVPAPVITSVWQRGTPVSNIWETIGPAVPGTSYTKVTADNGKHIQVWEVATNAAGSASQASNVLGPVVDSTVGPPTLTTLGALAWNPTVGLTSTYDPLLSAAWPAEDSPKPIVSMALPAARSWVPDTTYPSSQILRLSDSSWEPPTSGPYWNNFGPIYGMNDPFNSAGDLVLVRAMAIDANGNVLPHWLPTSIHLLSADTGAYLGACMSSTRALTNQVRWSRTDPDLVYFLDPSISTTQILTYRPSTKAFGVAKDFGPTYSEITMDWSGSQGDPTDDSGRYWAMAMKRGGQWYVVCWDQQTDTILGEIQIPQSIPDSNQSMDVGMAKSGQYVVILSTENWSQGGVSRGRGLSVYSRTGAFQRTLWQGPGSPTGDQTGATGFSGHNWVGTDIAGMDVFCYVHSATGNLNDRHLRSVRLDGTQATPGVEQSPSGLFVGLHYVGLQANGWALVSDHPVRTDNSNFNSYSLRGAIWAVKLDGTKKVYPIAPARISRTNYSAADDYFLFPWAVSDRNMTRVLYKSSFSLDWSAGIPSNFHAYLARTNLGTSGEVWANATSIERRWTIDGHEILDADMPWLHIPRDAWGTPGLRIRATGPGGTAVHNVTHSTIVGQPSGLSPLVRQGGTSGLTPGPFPNGSAPVPLSGGATFVTVEGMSITATGALHTTGTDNHPYGWATLELGALPNGRHKVKFVNLSRSIRQEFAFCLSEGWGGHFGSARGYMIRVSRPDWVMSTPMKVELLKLNGAGAAAVVMTDYGDLGATVTEYEVDLTITPTSLAFTLTPNVGAAISGSSTDTAYRGSRLQIGDVVGTGAGAKTLITLQAAHHSAVAIPQADRYQLTWADEFNDTDRSRFTDVGTPQAGKKVWRTRFSWTEDINGESQTYGGNLFELADGRLTIVAQRTSAPGQPQRWSSDVVTTEKTFAEQYGYFEFRFKAPKGKGFWIALWLMGIEDTWPGGEIDIVEHDGSFPTRFSHALHHANPATGADVATGSFPTIPYEREVDEWNVVSGEWNPDGTIQFRVNHSPTWLASHTMHRPMYVLMNLALAPTPEAVPGFWIVGPDASTPSPGRFAIDYVRCWQRPSHKANLPVISTPPMMSRTGNVLTITPGVSNAASVRGVLRTGTAGGAMEIASTVTNRANGNAVATFTYTLSSNTPNGKVNWYEEHTSSSGGKIQTASPWTWWESGGSGPQVCQLLITAPDTIANDQTLSYSLALVDGICDTWQTWLLTASGTGGTTGDGAFIGQTDSVGGGAAGSYIKNISNLPPGNYKIWGKCNSASSSCNQSWAVKNITITAGTTPPPPAPPPSGAVPTAILNLPSAPMPTSSQFTTKAAQGWSENWQTGSDGDWGSLKRRGFYLCQNNCWQVGSGLYNLQFVADPNASLSGTQFHQRVGLGTMTSAGTVSCQMRVRLPSHSVIQSVRGGGVISEVVTYPELQAGQILGIGHYQQQKIPNAPIRFGDIRSFWLGAKAWNSTVTGNGWIAHDMRACNTPAHDDTYAEGVAAVDCEILITHRHFPVNRNLSPGATSGTYCGEFNLGGNLYRVYIQQGATRYSNGQYAGLIQFRTVNGLPNHVNIYPIIEFLLTKTYAELGHYGTRARGRGLNDTLISPNMWWVQSVTGMETESGAYDLDIDSYYCRINQDI